MDGSKDRMAPARAPTLDTPRLLLRAHSVDDYAACIAMWAHPEVTRFITGRPSTAQQTWSRILGYAGHWSLMGFGYWAVEEKASGQFIGELGFADFKREMTPAAHRVPELGWALVPHAHGKGYATEALRAAIAWADAHPAWPRTVCLVDSPNAPSRRVADKCGYREVEQLSHEDGSATIVYSRPRADEAAGSAAVAAPDGPAAKAEIDAIASAFFGAFSGHEPGPVSLAKLRELFLPDAVIVVMRAGEAHAMSLESFIVPREALLGSGELVAFVEHEVDEQTTVTGAIAQRRCRYRKSGVSSGVPFEGGGRKSFQLVRSGGRFRIASLVWEDDP